MANAVAEAKELVSKGFKEIVLTGVNIGEYESTSGERLVDLVKGIVEVEGLERLRLSSVEPNTITKELLETLKESGKYQDHFHIPMQSGSDEILKSMRRKYDVAFYRKTIEMVKEYFPNASIGADIIVGYPGETEEQFLETYKLLRELPITHFHVFPYSKRKNTTAAKQENHIQGPVKKERVKSLIALGEEKVLKFKEDLLGTTANVLFEQEREGYFFGYTSNYIKVKMKSDKNIKNQILPVKIEDLQGVQAVGILGQ